METFYNCPLCGSNNLKPHSVRYKIFYPHSTRCKCSTCGIIFANPMADEIELLNFYQNYYDSGNFSHDNWKLRTADYFIQNKVVPKDEFIKRHKSTFDYYHLNVNSRGRFLDIGCGLGRMIYTAKKCDWTVHGTEFDKDAINFIKEHMPDADLYHGDFIQAAYPDNYFDYILLYHVIEHVTDPKKVITELKRILKPGGWLFIGTPNMGNWGYRAYRLMNFLRGNIPGIIDGVEHTFLFTKKRLADLVKNDFDIVYHKAEAHTEGLKTILNSGDALKRKITRIIQLIVKVNQRIVCSKK